MKILVNAFSARTGGGKWFTRSLLLKLCEKNPEWYFIVYYADQNFIDSNLRWQHIEFRYIPEALPYSERILWQQFKLRRIIKREKIDLLFSPLNIAMIYPPIPQVTIQRNAHHLLPKAISSKGLRWLKRRFQTLATLMSIKSSSENIFVSNYMLALAKNWINEDKNSWHVIHNAIDVERFQSTIMPHVDSKYILYVGLIEPHKNIELLIKAFRRLIGDYSHDLKLVLVGKINTGKNGTLSRWGKQLQRIVNTGKMGDKVMFMDSIEGDYLASLYKYAEICVIPSLLESFGVVPAEALYCGTPCVVSNIPVFHEVYGDSVMYCDPESPKDLANKMMVLLRDHNLGERMIKKAHTILPCYGLSPIAEQYSKVLKKAANKSG